MGTSTSPEQLAAKLSRVAAAYADLDRVLVREAAALQRAAVTAAAPDHLRGVGKRGARLTVATKYGGSAEPQALVFARGPWQLIERDTSPHQIPRQRRTRSFEGVFGHAVIPGGVEGGTHGRGGVRTRVQHPGTKGQHPWAKGTDAARPAIERLFQTQCERVLGAVF